MSTAPKRAPIPFGSYLLLDRINIGGMAEVWRGKQVGAQGFERLVAIKRILPNIAEDEEFITMFIDEAKITVQLTHANVAQVYELGHIQNNYFIAMEYIAGKDMRAIFDRCRKKSEPAPVPLTCYVVSKMCEGLDYAHRKKDGMGRDMNIVHRDISPQNILISYEGEVKVIDFGIAKAAGKATKTQAGILKGKFAYMSPEQIRGLPLDRRSDVFAIGVCLYEMLTGERLFVGDSDFSVLEKVRKAEVTPPSHFNKRVPDILEKIVLKALAKDVEDRYQYASEIADDLQRFLITSDSIFSRKDLMQYMKSTFAEDVEREKLRIQEYAEIQPPEGMIAAVSATGQLPMANPSLQPLPPLPTAPVPAQPIMAAPILTPSGGGPARTAIVGPPQAAATGQIRRSPSLTSLPKLTAAAPLLSNQDDPSGGKTIMADGNHAGAPVLTPAQPEHSGGGGIDPTAVRPRNRVTAAPMPMEEEDEPATAAERPPMRLSARGNLAPVEDGRDSAEPQPPRRMSRDRLPAPATSPTQPALVAQGVPSNRPVLLAAVGAALVAVIAALVIVLVMGRHTVMGYLVVQIPPEIEAIVHVNINGQEEDTRHLQNHLLVKQVKADKAVVLVSAEGYEPYTEVVTISEGKLPTPIKPKLKRAEEAAELIIAVEPEQAEIKLDGKVVKEENDRNGIYVGHLIVGQDSTGAPITTKLEVRRAGFKKYSRPLSATSSSQPVRVNVRLEPLDFPVSVTSEPKGASIYVAGRELGLTPANITLPGGVTSLVLRKKCHEELTVPVRLPEAPGSAPTPINGALRRTPGCR